MYIHTKTKKKMTTKIRMVVNQRKRFIDKIKEKEIKN